MLNFLLSEWQASEDRAFYLYEANFFNESDSREVRFFKFPRVDWCIPGDDSSDELWLGIKQENL
jgi:hypothetical protein